MPDPKAAEVLGGIVIRELTAYLSGRSGCASHAFDLVAPSLGADELPKPSFRIVIEPGDAHTARAILDAFKRTNPVGDASLNRPKAASKATA